MDSTSHAGFELTPFDTGARLEPFVYQVQPANLPDAEEADRYGKVDFDNADGQTMFTVWAETASTGITLHVISQVEGVNLTVDHA